MRNKIIGYNYFPAYDTFEAYVDYPHKNPCKSAQLRFGGFAISEQQNVKRELTYLKKQIRATIHSHSKDGYYKPKFLFIDNTPETFEQLGKGKLFFEVFLFFEETYDKKFFSEYIPMVLEDIYKIYSSNKTFEFKKYLDYAKKPK